MLEIGKIAIQGELKMVPVDDLVEDVPVDGIHVENLRKTLITDGQISPLVVWLEHHLVIDGFHRLRAMKLAGITEALCLLYSCSEETFWHLRILNARMHRSVSFARIVEWVQKSFLITQWADRMGAEEAFRMGRRGAAPSVALTPEEREALTAWVRQKAAQWNLAPERVSDMLKIRRYTSLPLLREVRDQSTPGAVTEQKLRAVVTRVREPMLQSALVEKIKAERLSLREVEELSAKIAEAKTEEEKARLLNVEVERTRRGYVNQYKEGSIEHLRMQVVANAAEQIANYLPNLSPSPLLDVQLRRAQEAINQYFAK